MKPLIVPFFISHQGCPHQCVFCNQVKISGSTGEFPLPGEITGKISEYRRTGRRKAVEVAFFGGSFTCLPATVQKQLLLPVQPLIAAGEVSAIRVSTRPDAVDNEVAEFLRVMGVSAVELGVQSLSNDVLAHSGRGHTSEDVAGACSVLREKALRVGLQLMPGLPGDSMMRSVDSLAGALALKPDFLRIYPTVVIAGTQLERLYQRGAYKPLELSEAVDWCKVMLRMACKAGVPVIRLGLQPTGELESPGVVIAGPYHPAFRQLVEGELFYDLLLHLSEGLPEGKEIALNCASSRVSDVAGQRRRNVCRLHRERGLSVTSIKADRTFSAYEVHMYGRDFSKKGNVLDDLRYAL